MDDHNAFEHTSRRRSSVPAILAAAGAVACAAALVTAALTPAAVASATPSRAPSPAAASSPAGAHHGVTVLRFAVKFSPFHVVDVPPLAKHAGDYGIGDYAVFSDQLLNSRGRVVGAEDGSGLITGVSASGAAVFFDMAIALPQGQIAAQGLASTAPSKRLAIVGGTGRYVGASGHIELVENGNGTGSLVITLGA